MSMGDACWATIGSTALFVPCLRGCGCDRLAWRHRLPSEAKQAHRLSGWASVVRSVWWRVVAGMFLTSFSVFVTVSCIFSPLIACF